MYSTNELARQKLRKIHRKLANRLIAEIIIQLILRFVVLLLKHFQVSHSFWCLLLPLEMIREKQQILFYKMYIQFPFQ